MNTIAIGKIIKNLRNQKGINQKELAERLNVSPQTVSKWETGNAYPDIGIIPKIANYFQITIDMLFYDRSDDLNNSIEESIQIHLEENKKGWDHCEETGWKGAVLPSYGPFTPGEEKLQLFGDVRNKAVLELACGDGTSLLYMANRGVRELYGLDISEKRIESAKRLLAEHKQEANLFVSPMELDPGIPLHHFDCVYSIYGLGWSLDIYKVCELVSRYLKENGIFIFSWDNPLLPCLESEEGRYQLEYSYEEERPFYITKFGQEMYLRNWKLATYINALASNGFVVERMVEESDGYAVNAPFSERYYSEHRARYMNHTFIIKARKL